MRGFRDVNPYMPQHLADAIQDAKTRRERPDASEYGPGPDAAPLVNRDHRRTSATPPVPVTSNRPHPGRPRPHLAD